MPSTTIQYFEYAHLPEKLQAISKPLSELAHEFESLLPDGPEKSAGMRKLLEAKDCFVRASMETAPSFKPLSAMEGLVVHYVLNDIDAEQINRRRVPGVGHGEDWPAGAQAHVGNPAMAGLHLPAVIVRVWGPAMVNLQVLLDGNDQFWKSSVGFSSPSNLDLGTWHWIEKA